MNQTPQNEKKSRFQLSREVQEEFVNGIAQTMLSLAENAEQSQPSVTETPFCPATGKEYSGANMVRLTLTAMEKGYTDNRWLTFKQLQAVREEYPDLNIRIRKGEHGVTVLRRRTCSSRWKRTESGILFPKSRQRAFLMCSDIPCCIPSRSSMRPRLKTFPPGNSPRPS